MVNSIPYRCDFHFGKQILTEQLHAFQLGKGIFTEQLYDYSKPVHAKSSMRLKSQLQRLKFRASSFKKPNGNRSKKLGNTYSFTTHAIAQGATLFLNCRLNEIAQKKQVYMHAIATTIPL